ncbi:hypothetical protein J4E91_011178 [Alternaria rosae]|nr:hypothetical protein J4E91_011178 [Alternaria rosae]
MSDDEDDYHQHQRNWEARRDEGYDDLKGWAENEQRDNEEMLAEMEAERRGREEAREEYGDDDRIEKLKVRNKWCGTGLRI